MEVLKQDLRRTRSSRCQEEIEQAANKVEWPPATVGTTLRPRNSSMALSPIQHGMTEKEVVGEHAGRAGGHPLLLTGCAPGQKEVMVPAAAPAHPRRCCRITHPVQDVEVGVAHHGNPTEETGGEMTDAGGKATTEKVIPSRR